METRKMFLAVFAFAAAIANVGNASAQDPFYKGKRLTVLVNFAPGGGADFALSPAFREMAP